MSDTVLQPDLDALHQSAIDILAHVSDTMEQGVKLLQDHDRLLCENQSDYRLGNEIEALAGDLRYVKNDLERVKQRELTMTIVAPTSAGKSTIINAIAEQDLLPSRNHPMTILPTEIVFLRDRKTQPKLILDQTLVMRLKEIWRQLHEKIQAIGVDKAVLQATTNDFPDGNPIQKIFNTVSAPFQAETGELNSIKSTLIEANDVLRLSSIFGIPTEFLSSLSQIPRIEVPFPSRFSSLDDLGKLLLIDTPGLSEDTSLNLVNVAKERLKASSLILLALNFRTIGQTDPAKVKKIIDEIAELKGRDRIYIVVNQIDARNPNKLEDLTTEQILELVKTKYEIDDPINRVFEISAIKAFVATSFQRELRIRQPTKPQEMITSDGLGQQYYGDYWKKHKSIVTLAEMQEAAEGYWYDSGFDRFISTAIAPLVADTKPSSIGIKAALKDTSGRLSAFQSCLERQKGMIDLSLQKSEDNIRWVEADLRQIEIINFNDRWQVETTEYILKNLEKIAFEELDIIFKKQEKFIREEFERNLHNSGDYILEVEDVESIMNIYIDFKIKQLENKAMFYLDGETKTKLIDWINNYFNHSDNFLFYNAQKRLSVNLTFLPWDCLGNVRFRDPRSYLSDRAYFMRDKLAQTVHYESVLSSINNWKNINIKKEVLNLTKINTAFFTIGNTMKNRSTISVIESLRLYDQKLEEIGYVKSIENPPTVLSEMILHRYKFISEKIMSDLFVLINSYEVYLFDLLQCNQKIMGEYLILSHKYIGLMEDTINIAKNAKWQQIYNKGISGVNYC